MQTYVDNFSDYLIKERNRSNNTVLSYRRDLMQFMQFLQQQGLNVSNLDKINKTTIMSYILHLEKDGKTASTISRNIASLKTFFKYLLNNAIVKADPVYKIKSPRISKKTPKSIDLQSIDLLLAQPCDDDKKCIRDKAILELLFATGIKATEIITLKISDINLKMEYIECLSSNKKRIIPIGRKAIEALENYIYKSRNKLLKNPAESALFVNCKGLPFTRQGLWKIIKFYSEKAGLDESVTPNILRHSFAAHLVSNGADMESLKEMMGHTDLSTTQVYFKSSTNKLKDVYNKAHPRK